MSEGQQTRELWNAAIELSRVAGQISDSHLAFIQLARPIVSVDGLFVVAVNSEFVKNWLEDHVLDILQHNLTNICGNEVRLVFSVDNGGEAAPVIPENSKENNSPTTPLHREDTEHVPSPLDTFENYSNNTPPSSQEPYDSNKLTSLTYSHDSALDTQSSVHSAFYEEEQETYSQEYETAHTNNFSDDAALFAALQAEQSMTSQALSHTQSSNTTSPFPSKTNQAIYTNEGLNPRYTFDNFVIGDSNRFAHACSRAVSEAPGTAYNPVFLYSDSGMGKTHLMHAIGNYALRIFPHIKVRYISAEEFTNYFINAVRDGRQAEFKDQFRKVDILLIDDIQFIGGHTTTVEEFFHTFNALINANKQIVITSDVAPNFLNGFEERMISRFNSGVTAEINHPSLETRIAILEKKAHADGLTVPREVTEYIAANMTTNIREMEGALRRVTAYADLNKQATDLTLAKVVLRDLLSAANGAEITGSLIMGKTAEYFGITLDDLTSSNRSRSIATGRQIAMYLCRELTELSLPKIGELFGGRDHSTVIHAYKKINNEMSEKQTLFNQVSELTSRIKQAANEANK